MEARGIRAHDDSLVADVTGEVEKSDDGVLMLRRVSVRYRLVVPQLDEDTREKVERVMGFHQRKCPVARSLEGAVQISTDIDLVEEGS